MLGTLKKVKAMGYQGVEFAQDLNQPAVDIRKALDEAGLVCCGWHTPWSRVQADKIDSTIEYFKNVGNTYIIVPGMPDEMTATPEAAKNTARFYNELASKLGKHDLSLGYHNHASELHFYPGTDQCPFTAFFDNTDPAIVVQMDNGHVLNGRGPGMLSLLRRYPNRYKTVHLKPYSLEKGAIRPNDGYNTMIGQDDVPWMDFMALCKRVGGTEWYIVEYESVAMYPELQGVEECLKALNIMEKRGDI